MLLLAALDEAAAVAGDVVDHDRWAVVVRDHAPFLRRSIARLSGPGPHVDDIVQDAFVSAFRRRSELPDDDGKLRGWLYRAARHHLAHHRRTFARAARKAAALAAADTSVDSGIGGGVGSADAADEARERQRKARLVRDATAALDPALREVFVLVVLEGLSAVDAAVVLDVNENTLRSRLSRARAAFAAAVGALDV